MVNYLRDTQPLLLLLSCVTVAFPSIRLLLLARVYKCEQIHQRISFRAGSLSLRAARTKSLPRSAQRVAARFEYNSITPCCTYTACGTSSVKHSCLSSFFFYVTLGTTRSESCLHIVDRSVETRDSYEQISKLNLITLLRQVYSSATYSYI